MAHNELGDQMKSNAEVAVKIARHFGHVLDYSEESVKAVDLVLDSYYKKLSKSLVNRIFRKKAAETELRKLSLAFGCYIGEVLRLATCGSWVTVDGALAIEANGQKAFPLSKAAKRIKNGSEDSVVSFCSTFVGIVQNRITTASVT